jgi:hypothetical protein
VLRSHKGRMPIHLCVRFGPLWHVVDFNITPVSNQAREGLIAKHPKVLEHRTKLSLRPNAIAFKGIGSPSDDPEMRNIIQYR